VLYDGDRKEASMQHVHLGRTGLRVSRLCLGTMTFGLQCDAATSVAILDRAAAGGITFLDASDVYPMDELTRGYRWGDDIR
jgi:aryl-alcohol dehydrogenase-like predicted oxidoreductase